MLTRSPITSEFARSTHAKSCDVLAGERRGSAGLRSVVSRVDGKRYRLNILWTQRARCINRAKYYDGDRKVLVQLTNEAVATAEQVQSRGFPLSRVGKGNSVDLFRGRYAAMLMRRLNRGAVHNED